MLTHVTRSVEVQREELRNQPALVDHSTTGQLSDFGKSQFDKFLHSEEFSLPQESSGLCPGLLRVTSPPGMSCLRGESACFRALVAGHPGNVMYDGTLGPHGISSQTRETDD